MWQRVHAALHATVFNSRDRTCRDRGKLGRVARRLRAATPELSEAAALLRVFAEPGCFANVACGAKCGACLCEHRDRAGSAARPCQ